MELGLILGKLVAFMFIIFITTFIRKQFRKLKYATIVAERSKRRGN